MSTLKRCHNTAEEEDESKEKKLKIEQDDDYDRISELPNALLHHILGQLGNTKEAINTRVLSKKWKSLWNSIPILDFGESSPPPPRPCASLSLSCKRSKPKRSKHAVLRARLLMKFRRKKHAARARSLMNFIENALLNRQPNSPINNFRLYLHDHFDSSRVFSWILYLIKHRIQHLDLVFHQAHRHFAFPCSFFTSHSLTVFKLEIKSHLNLPTSATSLISFPNLKILSLKYLSLSDDVGQLFSSCPVLEELYFDQCKWVNMNTVKISALALHTLSLLQHCGDFQIFAPNITTLSFSGNLTPARHFILGNLPSLSSAHLNVYVNEQSLLEASVRLQQLAIKFLQPFAHVPLLTLHHGIGQALFKDNRLLHQLNTLENLISLTLNWDSRRFTYQTLLNILHAAPNLENLYLEHVWCGLDLLDHFRAEKTLPHCLLLNLKHIHIRITSGYMEASVIGFFLRNARVLEEMVITFHYDVHPGVKEALLSRVVRITPRCSQNCRIVFIHE